MVSNNKYKQFNNFKNILLIIFNLLENFMVVDCGDDTVDLTTIQLLADEKLIIISERIGNNCGNSFVCQEFLKFLEHKVGSSAINLLRKNRPDQLQYIVQQFFQIQSEFCYPIVIDLEGNILKSFYFLKKNN